MRAAHHVILDNDVTGKARAVAGYEVVADHTIVRDMAGGEQHVVVTHDRHVAIVGGGVDGDVFTKHVARADAHARVAALEFQVLGLAADVRIREYLALGAEVCVALDRGVVMQAAAVAQAHAGTHVGEGPISTPEPSSADGST